MHLQTGTSIFLAKSACFHACWTICSVFVFDSKLFVPYTHLIQESLHSVPAQKSLLVEAYTKLIQKDYLSNIMGRCPNLGRTHPFFLSSSCFLERCSWDCSLSCFDDLAGSAELNSSVTTLVLVARSIWFFYFVMWGTTHLLPFTLSLVAGRPVHKLQSKEGIQVLLFYSHFTLILAEAGWHL